MSLEWLMNQFLFSLGSKLAQRQLILDKAEEYGVPFVPASEPDTYTCAKFWNQRANHAADAYQHQFIDHAQLVIHDDGVWRVELYEYREKTLKLNYSNEGFKGAN